jgi:hypothetical protein
MIVMKFHTLEYELVPPAFLAFTRQKCLVLFANGPTCLDVVVTVESSSTVVAKSESVETCTVYDAAVADAFHAKVNVAGWSTELLGGDWRAGGDGGAMIVVKFHTLEYELVPPAFFAFTRQKYIVLFAKGPTCLDVVVTVESFRTVVPKSESVDTCTVYDAALADAFHANVNVAGWSTEAIDGDWSVGGGGGAMIVVKCDGDEKALTPALFFALTCQ